MISISFFNFWRSFLSTSSSSSSESCRMKASFSLRESSPAFTSRVFLSLSPASASNISPTSSRSFSGSSSSTSSTSTSWPSIFTTAAFPPFVVLTPADATGAGGATKSNSARFKTRLGVPRAALRIFSTNFGTDISSSRASTTNS